VRTQDSVYGGAIVDIAEESLSRAEKLLVGIKNGAQIAVGNALARAATSGKTMASRAITKEYLISQAQVRENTYNINHFTKSSDGGITVSFGYKGYVIPLIKFDTSIDQSGKIKTRVKRNGTKEILDRAFIAKVGGHTGVFEREYDELRTPIQELFGPSTPQMMYSNEAVLDSIEDKAIETYEKRIEHEITRLLNGWGRF